MPGSVDNVPPAAVAAAARGTRAPSGYPNVILWVTGHTHRNQALPPTRSAGSGRRGGFWEVNTAAHID